MSEMSMDDFILNAAEQLVTPVESNEPALNDENLIDPDAPLEDEEESNIEDDTDSDESGTAETKSEDDPKAETYTVKVDGETVDVTLEELKNGYSRTAHFTRQMQELSEQKEAFSAEVTAYKEQLDNLQALDTAWEVDPTQVIVNLVNATDNPELTLGLLIRGMAVENTLGEQTLSYFGIDDARLTQLSTEYELDRLKREAYERQLAEEKQSEANSNLQMQNSVQEAVQKFNNQINEIITEEGLDLPTLAEKDQLKADILKYARDNGIYDMHKAYNALAYERQKEAKAKQAKVEQSHAKKSATQKVSKGGAGAGQTTSSNDGKSLDDIIWENMGKLGMK